IPEQLNPVYELTDYLKLLNPLTTSLSKGLISDIQIYPNPTTGFIHIRIPEGSQGKLMKVSILDLGGQRILNHDIKQAKNNSHISLENITPGFYVMKIQIGEQVHYEKFRKL
ncbi:MAG: T9SS type A sorting domain-containing protein, partial [Bacteroidota bacterium]